MFQTSIPGQARRAPSDSQQQRVAGNRRTVDSKRHPDEQLFASNFCRRSRNPDSATRRFVGSHGNVLYSGEQFCPARSVTCQANLPERFISSLVSQNSTLRLVGSNSRIPGGASRNGARIAAPSSARSNPPTTRRCTASCRRIAKTHTMLLASRAASPRRQTRCRRLVDLTQPEGALKVLWLVKIHPHDLHDLVGAMVPSSVGSMNMRLERSWYLTIGE